MTIETAPRRYAHESIPVPLLRDKRLSFRARGIASRLLSNTPGFRMTAEDLARESPAEGRFAVLTAMKELRKYGYAKVIRTQDERGRWSTVTRISGWPEPECNDCTSDTEVQLPNVGVPNSGEPTFGDCTPKSSSSTNKDFQEEKTTTGSHLNWDALPQLSIEQQVVVVEQVKELPVERRQDVLDELAGALRAKAIKGQWPGWLHGVVQKAMKGGFKPNHALAIQAERKQRIEARELASKRQAEDAERKKRNTDPTTQARRKAQFAAIEAALRP